MDLVLTNCKIVDEISEHYIGIENGKIKKISKIPIKGEKIIDINHNFLLPGFIDPHVHFRDPGFPKKENFKSGSMAAANGGFTTVIDMPNTKPETNTYKNFKNKIKIAEKKSVVDFGLHSGINNINELKHITELKPISFKIFMDLLSDKEIEESFKNISILNNELKSNYKISLHCENKDIIEKSTHEFKELNEISAIDYSYIRNSKAEVSSINQALNLSKKYNVPIHICHLSTKEGLKSIINHEINGLVSTEITAHHLLLTNETFNKVGTIAKTNPPLRPNNENLTIKDLKNIDMIGSDHAPHTIEDKNKGVFDSSPGIPGLETTVSLLLTELNKGNINLKTIQKTLSYNPAKVFNLKNKGEIAIGKDADFTVLDIKKEGKINQETFYSLAKYTPFEGRKYKGKAIMTILKGEIVMNNGEVYNTSGNYLM
jgi:dihydroorotase